MLAKHSMCARFGASMWLWLLEALCTNLWLDDLWLDIVDGAQTRSISTTEGIVRNAWPVRCEVQEWTEVRGQKAGIQYGECRDQMRQV